MIGRCPCDAFWTAPGCAWNVCMVVRMWPAFLSFVRAVLFMVSRDSLLAVILSSLDPSSYTCIQFPKCVREICVV